MRKPFLAMMLLILSINLVLAGHTLADEPTSEQPLIGYTELQTNLPGGRHANVRTMRATVVRADGSGRARIADELADETDAWTQFAGWSPDGKQAIVSRGWQDAENANWEQEHKTFRMEPKKWLLDSCLVNIATGKVSNLTAVDRVSHYNGGLFFMPEVKTLGSAAQATTHRLGFTPLINGVSKPFVMDLDGRNKQDLSSTNAGFTYGYSASPDGNLISYHENYQVYIARADGSEKRHINTGHPFDFGPRWSPDGKWLLFLSGEHYDCHPHIVRADGTGLKKLADRAGYRGVTEFLDVDDFHAGRWEHSTYQDARWHNALSSYPVRGRQAVALWFETQWCSATVRDDPRRSRRDATHPSQDRLRSHVAALATG